MKLYHKLLFLVAVCSYLYSSDMQFVVKSKDTEKMPLGLVFVGKPDSYAKSCMNRLEKDLQYSGQCKIDRKTCQQPTKADDMKRLFKNNTSLALFIAKEGQAYSWRLYDLLSAEMIAGKKVMIEDKDVAVMAHEIADDIWPVLMGKKSSFSSKIAYCKQIWKKFFGRDKVYKQIWIADFDGSNSRLFVDAPTVSFAPRWSMQLTCPLLFYSENTLSNVQLIMSNMFKKHHVMCCFDGLNMQPTFSANGKEVVFCLSKDGSSQLYRSYTDVIRKKRLCDRLTDNHANNIAPCFIDADHVAFVSDFETRKPQVYIMNIPTKKLKRITEGGYCACPAYCQENNKLVYSKMIDGCMQLVEYDCSNQKHRQLTTGPGSKEEASWSSCGNYITFGMNQGAESRIAQLNLLTGKYRYLTPVDQHCSYPSCSPVYDDLVGILR